jgi:hypothetical protein
MGIKMNSRKVAESSHNDNIEMCKNIFIQRPTWWAIVVGIGSFLGMAYGTLNYEQRLTKVEQKCESIDVIRNGIDTLLVRTRR